MEEETQKRLDAQDELLLKIYTSVEKTRKYFMWTLIATLIMFVLPLIGLVFVIPQFINSYIGGLGGLDNLGL